MEKINNEFNPLVSIIIPVYNGSNYMKEAIDSALAQTYKNIEVIVVNDGSTDNTEEIARSYGDKIRYFVKENGGVSSALNLAIHEMRGEYFSWLSHDDVYYNNKISEQINYLKRCDNKIPVLYGNVEFIDNNSKVISKTCHEKSHSESNLNHHLYPVLKGLVNGCSLLVDKKCFDVVGMFDEKLKTSNDYDMWFRIFRLFKVEFMPNILIKYRLHEKQGTKIDSVFTEESNKLWIDIIEKITPTEVLKFEDSLFVFYFKMAEQMKMSAYSDAYFFARKLAEKHFYENSPKLSVIMPCYNTGIYLRESIESILNQTFCDFELIIIDDCSHDDSVEIIKKYAKDDFRIILIRNSKNLGISRTMNEGLKISRGKYITRMDSDDISLPQRFEKQVSFLDKNEDYSLCSVNISTMDSNGLLLSESLFERTNIPLEWLFLWKNPIANAPAMYRKSLVDTSFIMFEETLKIAEDYDFLCRNILNTKYFYIDENLYKYRIHSKSIFQRNTDKARENSICISRNLAKKLSKQDPPKFHDKLTDFTINKNDTNDGCDVIDMSLWMNNLLIKASDQWNWNHESFYYAKEDANRRILNYITKSYGVNENNDKKVCALEKDVNSKEVFACSIKDVILNKIYNIPLIGRMIYCKYFAIKRFFKNNLF